MPKILSVEKKNFVSASEAGRSVGYTPDYVAKLARDGKLEATRVGRQWYVTLESVKDFVLKIEEGKKARGEEIRRERLREQHEFKRQNGLLIPERRKELSRLDERLVAATETLLVLGIGLTIGLSGYFISNAPSSQMALVAESELNPFERFSVLLYDLVIPQRKIEISEITTREVIPASSETTETSLEESRSMIIAPEEDFDRVEAISVSESFSDSVTITPDFENPDTGIITPHFRSENREEYRYLMVPVRADSES